MHPAAKRFVSNRDSECFLPHSHHDQASIRNKDIDERVRTAILGQASRSQNILENYFLRYFDGPLAVLDTFVCQINRQPMPTRTRNGFGQPMINHHPLYRQILDANEIVSLYYTIAESV